jgi:hypothetical protein
MISFEEIKNVFVIYPPSCGGNHIANLISLHPAFNPKYVWDNYEQTMLVKYIDIYVTKNYHSPKSLNVHFDSFQKHINDYEENDEWLSDILSNGKKNVFTGHYTNFHNLFANKRLHQFKNYVGIVLTEPSIDSIPYRRNQLAGFNEENEYKNYQLPIKFPTTATIPEYTFITESNGIYINTEEFFTPNGFRMLNAKLLEKFGFSIDSKHQNLHDYWYKIATVHA